MRRSYSFVSTCSQAGWEEYGQRFVTSFVQHFPSDVGLVFYVDFKPSVQSPRVTYRNLAECYGLDEFQSRISRLPFAKGEAVVHDLHEQAHNPGIIWNARKFSYKVFTIEHAVANTDADVVTWLDADSIAFRDIDKALISSTMPPQCMLSYLGRGEKYSECGYIGYNLQHGQTRRFAKLVADLYRSGFVFSLKEWHDSYVFDVARSAFERKLGVMNFNISWRHAHADHVFINSELGEYLDHMKGPRKTEGRSRQADLLVQREADYWKR